MISDGHQKHAELIRVWGEGGVLEKVTPDLIPLEQGIVLVCCSDGDRFTDWFGAYIEMHRGRRPKPRIHPLAQHGCAIRLAENSLANRDTPFFDSYALLDLQRALAGKGFSTVVLHTHLHCMHAGAYEISPEQNIALLLAAKKRIKAENAGISVVALVSTDDPEDEELVRFVRREQWEEWYAKYQTREI